MRLISRKCEDPFAKSEDSFLFFFFFSPSLSFFFFPSRWLWFCWGGGRRLGRHGSRVVPMHGGRRCRHTARRPWRSWSQAAADGRAAMERLPPREASGRRCGHGDAGGRAAWPWLAAGAASGRRWADGGGVRPCGGGATLWWSTRDGRRCRCGARPSPLFFFQFSFFFPGFFYFSSYMVPVAVGRRSRLLRPCGDWPDRRRGWRPAPWACRRSAPACGHGCESVEVAASAARLLWPCTGLASWLDGCPVQRWFHFQKHPSAFTGDSKSAVAVIIGSWKKKQ